MMKIENIAFCFTLAIAGCAGSDYGGDDGSDPTADDGASDDDGADESTTDAGDESPDPTDDEGPGDSSEGGEESTGGDGAVSFAEDVLPIISARCSCHRNAAPSAGLDLSDGAAFDSLTANQSGIAPLEFVEPGSTDDSYLINKLAGTQLDAGGAGSRMPLGGEVTEEELMIFEAWVDDGAQP